jgi:2-keto-4-pentenoate hydratase/2-oxohepta-3-ene-1,7-dioic acid hydratase in catechol pathway
LGEEFTSPEQYLYPESTIAFQEGSKVKWCRFQSGDEQLYGIIEGDNVMAVDGTPFDGYRLTGKSHPLGEVKLLVPVIPPTFYAAGLNYREHATAIAQERGEEPNFPTRADIGYRANNALIAHEEAIIIPRDASEQVQYEGELVAVIGKECRRVSKDQALNYVLGYTIGNDVSERTWQRKDRTLWRAKNTDTFKPMGPWIVTDLDPEELNVTVRLNNKVVGEYNVRTAIFGVAHYISRMSQYLTLYPGDVLWMGTDGKTENMKDGDVVEVEISKIGILRNPVIRED